MTTALAAVGAALVLLLISIVAYHRGRRQGRVTLPPDLVAELRQHKLRCIGESPHRVTLEIGLLCETETRSDTSSSASRRR